MSSCNLTMAVAALAFRRVNKKCFHRIAALRPILVPVYASLFLPQSRVGSYGHHIEDLRNVFTQSTCQRGFEDALVDLKHGCSGQQRWYAGSNSSEKAKPDAESIATEMIKYAASSRNQEAAHGEAIRILEQGRVFLLNEGVSAANATGRVLLILATFYADRARLADAVEALQLASDLEPAGLEVRVAALEALTGLCLRLQQEESALRYAHSCGQLVASASEGVPTDVLMELQFRSKAVAALSALVCARCGAADSRLFEDVPAWLGENSRQTAGVAAAVLSVAQCAHVGGSLKIAGELYERTITIIQNSKEAGEMTLASVAMAPDEVHVGALAGLGQLATHRGDFEEAEGKITEALTLAEKINGDRHARVGITLACLADVFARRGKVKGSGDSFIIAEGLYRRSQEYMGSPDLDVPDTGNLVDFVDIMALSRARCAEIVSKFPNRDEEAERVKKWANMMWRGPQPLTDLMKLDGAQRSSGNETSKEGQVLIDVRLGRVIWKV